MHRKVSVSRLCSLLPQHPSTAALGRGRECYGRRGAALLQGRQRALLSGLALILEREIF